MLLFLCSIIFDRLSKNGRLYENDTSKHLNEYGEAGLRTLALAYRMLDESEYSAWNTDFLKAKTTIGPDREAQVERVSEMMERDLILVGATAVEDKLQRGVSFCPLLLYYRFACSFLLLTDNSCTGSTVYRQISASWSQDLGSDG